MDPSIVRQLMMGAIPPGILGVVLFAGLWWRKPAQDAATARSALWRAAVTPLLLGAAYAACHQFVLGRSPWPPASADARLPFIAAGLSILAAVTAAIPTPWGLALRLAGIVSAAWICLPHITKGPGSAEDWAQFGVAVIATAIAATCAEQAATERDAQTGKRRPRTGSGVAFVVASWPIAVSQLLVFGFHSLKQSQAVGIFAAFAAGAVIVAFWRRGLTLFSGGIYVLTVMTCVCLFQSLLYADADHGRALSLLAAMGPVLWLGVSRVSWLKTRPLVRSLAEAAAIVAPVATAITWALASASQSES